MTVSPSLLTSVKVPVNSKYSKATTQKTLQDSDDFQNCSQSKKDTQRTSFSTHAHPHTRGVVHCHWNSRATLLSDDGPTNGRKFRYWTKPQPFRYSQHLYIWMGYDLRIEYKHVYFLRVTQYFHLRKVFFFTSDFLILFAPENHFLSELSPSTKKKPES